MIACDNLIHVRVIACDSPRPTSIDLNLSWPVSGHLNLSQPKSNFGCNTTDSVHLWCRPALPIALGSSRSNFFQLPLAPDSSRSATLKTGPTATYRELPGATGAKIDVLSRSIPRETQHRSDFKFAPTRPSWDGRMQIGYATMPFQQIFPVPRLSAPIRGNSRLSTV